jgi:CheY-like chemotaxis protein
MRRTKTKQRANGHQPVGQQMTSVWFEDASLAALTHDLRNSLSSIVSALHILRLQRYSNSIAEQAGKTIERQAEHLSLLADHLSELAGVPKPRKPLHADDWQPAADRAEEISRRRILVVDDNKDAADSTGTLLLLWGHQVKVAYDGASAVAMARDYRPEVCLLDLGMPEISGYQVAEQLRQEPGLIGMLLVAMTGFDREADRQQSRAAGFDSFLVKPVEIAALQEVLGHDARHVNSDAPLAAGGSAGP